MKKIYRCKRLFICLFVLSSFTAHAQFNYISPMPGSKYHNPQTTIIFRAGDLLDESSIHNKDLIEIHGSKSGKHNWTSVLSENRTLIIKPDPIFAWDETVSVTVHSLLRKKDGSLVEGTSFSFMTRSEMTPEQKALLKQDEESLNDDEGSNASSTIREECSIDSLPTYQINVNNNPNPGQIFYNNQNDDHADTNSFPAIINNDGSLVWACDLGFNGHDFKINYNGYLTYFNYTPPHGWIIMDSSFNIIDSLECGNGYEEATNGHDLVMYPDGHSFLLAYDPQIIDMSQVVDGGNTHATVKGLIVQELDANKQVIFQWRSWDHFLLTDANPTVSLALQIVDPVHGNAVERDNDGNLLISCRNMSEITKINIETGDIIWRMGGKNNQFTFVNDIIPQHFSFQHDIRRIANGNVTLFNNGDDLPVEISSAKEYQLDEVNKVATLIWHYEHPQIDGHNVFGTGSGSVQRLANGSTLISWGKPANTAPGIPNFTEVDTANNITWEFTFDSEFERGFRVHRYVWNPCEIPKPDHVIVKRITSTSASIAWNAAKNAASYDVQYKKTSAANWKLKTTTKTNKTLTNLTAGKSYEFQVRSHCLNGYTSDWTPIDTFTTNPLRTVLNNEEMPFSLFPNPASGILNFRFESETGQQASISIFDYTGKIFFTSTFNLAEGEVVIPVDISLLPAGIYCTEVKTGDQRLIQSFIKQ